MKKQTGITLIALVITIIVLLILASISLNVLLGDNGILTKAKTVKEETEKSEIKEALSIAVSNIALKYSNNDDENLIDYYESKDIFSTTGDFNTNIYKILEYTISETEDKVTITIKKENGTGKQYVYEIILPSGEIKIKGEGIEETNPEYFTYSTSGTTATITGLSTSGQTAYNNGEL